MALFYYKIQPSDIDHLPAYEFSYGVVEAEPADVEAIVSQVAPGHITLLTIRPVDEAKVSLDRFRIDLGQGLSTYHGEEVTDTERCLADQPYIDAYEIDTSGDPALSHDGELEPDQDAEWTSYAPPANDTPMGLDQVLGCRVQDYELTLPPNKTEALAAALATELRQDLLDDGQTDDGVADAGLAELLWRFGWKTDEQLAANGWFRLWTDAGGIGERALRALGVIARFVVPGGWLDVVDDNGSSLNWLDAEDDDEGRYRLHFDGEGVTVERGDSARDEPQVRDLSHHPALGVVDAYIEDARWDQDFGALTRAMAAAITWSLDPCAGAIQMAMVADMILESDTRFGEWNLDQALVCLVGRPDRAALVRDRFISSFDGSTVAGHQTAAGIARPVLELHNLAAIIAAGPDGTPATVSPESPTLAEAVLTGNKARVRAAARRVVSSMCRQGNPSYERPEHWFPLKAQVLRLAAATRGFAVEVPTDIIWHLPQPVDAQS